MTERSEVEEVAVIVSSAAPAIPAPHGPVRTTIAVPDDASYAPMYWARLASVDPGHCVSTEQVVPGRQAIAEVLPTGALIQAEHLSEDQHQTWATCGDVGILLAAFGSFTRLLVSGPSRQRVHEMCDLIRSRCVVPIDDAAKGRLWLLGSSGPRAVHKELGTPPLSALVANYAPATARALAALAARGGPTGSGRLLLWHGPPGTGKTSAALGLLHAWRSWCHADIITDPEQMFSDAGYLVHILMQPTAPDEWRMLVCEDADEYLRSDARARSGPGLGRLLNATDGLLGRGGRVMILLTTNDAVGRLHPAVTRPGRCLSLLEFPLLAPEQASNWLGRSVTRPTALAELFEIRAGGTPVAPTVEL